MFYDYYLNTADEATMNAVLEGITADVSVIGHWYNIVGGTPEEPITEQVPGWHFNVRSTEEIVWPAEVSATTPVTPWRVWA